MRKRAEKPEAQEPKAMTLESFVAPYSPGADDVIEMPALNGGVMKFRRFKRYGQLEKFIGEKQRFAKRAVGKAIPAMAGIEDLTLGEAEAFYTLHALAIEPEIPLTEEAARFVLGAPFFVTTAIAWINENMIAETSSIMAQAVNQGKDELSTTPSTS